MDTRSDEDILKGFLRGDSDAFRELLSRFRPAFIKKISLHHAGLWHRREDMLDAAETRLFEWRVKHLKGEERFHPGESIQALAWRLAKQEAEVEGNLASHVDPKVRIEKLKLPARNRADDGVRYLELLQVIDSLGEEMSEVLTAEAERTENGGPPLEETLGISGPAARKRLERARTALKRRLWGKEDGDDGKT